MFDRFVLASKYQRIRERFDQASLPESEEYIPNYNIAPNHDAYVLLPELTFNPEALAMPKAVQLFFQEKMPTSAIKKMKFGLMGVEKEKKYFIRSEGDRNQSNDTHYTSSKAIFLNHKYKRVIRNQRCLVLADAFIVGINKKPYLVYLKDHKRPFGMAGLWSTTINENSLETRSFGILTVPTYQERRWMNKHTELSQVLSMLNPYPHHLMNAYPICDRIKDVENNNLSMIQPIGGRIYSERFEPLSRKRVKVERNNNDSTTWGDMVEQNQSDS